VSASDVAGSSRALPVLFVAAIAIISYDEIRHRQHFPPYPQRYGAAALGFALLGVLEVFAAPLAGALGLGLVIAVSMQAIGLSGNNSDTSGTGTQTAAAGTAGQVTTVGAGSTTTIHPVTGQGTIFMQA